MKYCSQCGKENQDTNTSCEGCGAAFEIMPAPPVQPSAASFANEPVTFGKWILVLFLSMIPCINIIMLFVWAFGGGAAKSLENYAKAYLVVLAILIGLALISVFAFLSMGIGILGMLEQGYLN